MLTPGHLFYENCEANFDVTLTIWSYQQIDMMNLSTIVEFDDVIADNLNFFSMRHSHGFSFKICHKEYNCLSVFAIENQQNQRRNLKGITEDNLKKSKMAINQIK